MNGEKTMTSKDYIKIADAITSVDVKTKNDIGIILNVIHELCHTFKEDNSNFDTERFYNYCVKKVGENK
jgi:hypothetical protein